MKFEKNTPIIDDILSCQRSLFVKTGLSYENNQNIHEEEARSKSPENKIEEKPKSYEVVLEKPVKNEENSKKVDDQYNPNSFYKRNGFKRTTPPRRPFTTRFQILFIVYSFSCNIFGHKAINCRAYAKSDHVRRRDRGDYVSEVKSSHENDRNYNPFTPLLYNIEYYKCNDYGHIAHNYRSNMKKYPRKNKEENVLIGNGEEYSKTYGKRNNKNKKNVNLHYMLKTKEANGTLIVDAQSI